MRCTNKCIDFPYSWLTRKEKFEMDKKIQNLKVTCKCEKEEGKEC